MRCFSDDEEMSAISPERGMEGTTNREVRWRTEGAGKEKQMRTVIVCEGREEKEGRIGIGGGVSLEKIHEDLNKGWQ